MHRTKCFFGALISACNCAFTYVTVSLTSVFLISLQALHLVSLVQWISDCVIRLRMDTLGFHVLFLFLLEASVHTPSWVSCEMACSVACSCSQVKFRLRSVTLKTSQAIVLPPHLYSSLSPWFLPGTPLSSHHGTSSVLQCKALCSVFSFFLYLAHVSLWVCINFLMVTVTNYHKLGVSKQ